MAICKGALVAIDCKLSKRIHTGRKRDGDIDMVCQLIASRLVEKMEQLEQN